MILLLSNTPFATDTVPDEPITQPTNRGNKLRANAKYVHEGALGFTNSRELYKQVCDIFPGKQTKIGVGEMPDQLSMTLEN